MWQRANIVEADIILSALKEKYPNLAYEQNNILIKKSHIHGILIKVINGTTHTYDLFKWPTSLRNSAPFQAEVSKAPSNMYRDPESQAVSHVVCPE